MASFTSAFDRGDFGPGDKDDLIEEVVAIYQRGEARCPRYRPCHAHGLVPFGPCEEPLWASR